MDKIKHLSDYKPQFDDFHDLMKFRVREILMVSSYYDAFVLEEDGSLSMKILGEYLDLDLRFIPRITNVANGEEALEKIKKNNYDLVITMTRISDMDPLEFGRKVKLIQPGLSVVLLTYEYVSPQMLIKARKTKFINKIFYWLGDSRILLAIIKYIEDIKNVDKDIKLGVRVIILIEDSPRFYSIYLPKIYTELMGQTRHLISDSVNVLQRMMRMRARPKVLAAETYEQAMRLYKKYKGYLLGVISDIKFPRKDVLDENAGFKLAGRIISDFPDLPFLLQSSSENNQKIAQGKNINFVLKTSENLLQDIRNFIMEKLGFGDFVFRLNNRKEIGRAKNLYEFKNKILSIPEESLLFHSNRNHFSIWLRARTEFELAQKLRPVTKDDFKNTSDLRKHLTDSIQNVIDNYRTGVISDFKKSNLDIEGNFIKIGSGSLGGKARGIAFLNTILEQTGVDQEYEDIIIKIPKTFVLCSEIFEEFLEKNKLLKTTAVGGGKKEIAKKFLKAGLPSQLKNELKIILEHMTYPLAVRSSSILEDSQSLPFAGLYSTYMLPNNSVNPKIKLKQLCDAIKLVFASIFYKSSREYIKNTNYRLEEEKMAVIIQEIVGQRFDNYFYPLISGVGQSFNYYPISYQKPDEGTVELALGLGKTIVERQKCFRYSPKYPKMNPLYSGIDDLLLNSQRSFYAVDMLDSDIQVIPDEGFSLAKLNLTDFENNPLLKYVCSTYDVQNDRITENVAFPGPRIVNFASVVKWGAIPLNDILKKMMHLGKQAFGCNVEIEFALNIFNEELNKKSEFNLLQIRPMVLENEEDEVEIKSDDLEKLIICRSSDSLGNGIYNGISDIVIVDPAKFDPSKTREIAQEVGEINQMLIDEGRKCLLIGFGRWGTSDPWLGIPAEWHQISQAKVIIESSLDDFKIDASRGSHFFTNLTSLKIGFINITNRNQKDYINWEWFNNKSNPVNKKFIKWFRLKDPLNIKFNGRNSEAIITL